MSNALSWVAIGTLSDIPVRGARTVNTPNGRVAVFRTADDRIFALDDRCPHKGGPLAQGIVHDRSVTCPLHNLVIDLATGEARGEDRLCARTLPVRVEGGRVLLGLGQRAVQAA